MENPPDAPATGSTPRREALLDAAAALFFQLGYAATSIDAIIERAGGSKRNVYSAFGGKEGLFAALIQRNVVDALAALDIREADDRDLDAVLLDFGVRATELYLSPTVVGLYRIVIAENVRFPALARAFFDNGPGRATAALAERLARARDAGEIEVDDPAGAADRFLAMMRDNHHLRAVLGLETPHRPEAMMRDNHHLRAVLGLETPPAGPEIRRSVDRTVSIFLDGVRRRAG